PGRRPGRRPAARRHRDHHLRRHRRAPARAHRQGRLMTMQTVGRPTRPEGSAETAGFQSLTGGRGLLQDEPLIFELDGWTKTGVDLPAADAEPSDLEGLLRDGVDLPGLSEPEAVRHYVRLSQKNHAI